MYLFSEVIFGKARGWKLLYDLHGKMQIAAQEDTNNETGAGKG